MRYSSSTCYAGQDSLPIVPGGWMVMYTAARSSICAPATLSSRLAPSLPLYSKAQRGHHRPSTRSTSCGSLAACLGDTDSIFICTKPLLRRIRQEKAHSAMLLSVDASMPKALLAGSAERQRELLENGEVSRRGDCSGRHGWQQGLSAARFDEHSRKVLLRAARCCFR